MVTTSPLFYGHDAWTLFYKKGAYMTRERTKGGKNSRSHSNHDNEEMFWKWLRFSPPTRNEKKEHLSTQEKRQLIERTCHVWLDQKLKCE
jgi:hypothetical protein